jgi:predicted SnoaL-like aldol condensation-catalyzing enzyme
MSVEENKAIVRRVFEEIWNKGNLALVDELYASDYIRHNASAGSPPGPAGEKRHRAAFRAAFPDLAITAGDVIAEGDRVAVRYHWQGTHQGA